MSNPKTVRVRIAVAVSPVGNFYAIGWKGWGGIGTDSQNAANALKSLDSTEAKVYFIEADVPLPASETVEGLVATGDDTKEQP